MKISDFQAKDVINIVDGKRLGHVSDLELDLRQGRIEAIVVPASTRFLGLFGGSSDLVIPWRNVLKIGADVILVKVEAAASFDPDGMESAYDYYSARDYRDYRGS
ncbi:YlmC/YmxH family sporulation protein [Paenibacillus sp. YYML68]|uniref:YlmC/YmxH family sporulation protein n=1 Tax=Paenibacillus sp. YYML68 TaxID=2909250 RepID=UPI0024907F41|nr:YlmC/YmxH family sporulation protein [Paenibacillus sp. YYML68]